MPAEARGRVPPAIKLRRDLEHPPAASDPARHTANGPTENAPDDSCAGGINIGHQSQQAASPSAAAACWNILSYLNLSGQ